MFPQVTNISLKSRNTCRRYFFNFTKFLERVRSAIQRWSLKGVPYKVNYTPDSVRNWKSALGKLSRDRGHYCHERAQHVFSVSPEDENPRLSTAIRRRGEDLRTPASRWRSIRDREPRRVPRRAPWSPRRDEIHVGWPAAWHWALKRKLNEISNRQELPRIGPIKLLPPVPRVYARILTVNFVVGN